MHAGGTTKHMYTGKRSAIDEETATNLTQDAHDAQHAADHGSCRSDRN